MAYNKTLQHERRQYFIKLAGGKCVKCSATRRLEFDHIDPKTKHFQLTSSKLEFSMGVLMEEFSKCQLLCKPCHMKKSILERGREFVDNAHGTKSRYNNLKCRCLLCKSAHNDYMKLYRARKRLQLRA